MATSRDFVEELRWRGLLFQHTPGVEEALQQRSLSAYCGFDPTAPSLHVGHLVPVMGLVHLQRCGHRPVALVGGGTGLIGDPSGRSSERPLADEQRIAENAESLRQQLALFLDFQGPYAAVLSNNAEWLRPLSAISFLRDVGKHFSVNYMLAKESVKARLDEGISFTEFAYMLLQAYDYLELYRREGVTLQIGGSDQWGNITAGIELVRRAAGATVHGLTMPLVTRADGAKFGKTEAGNVWLDAKLTSPYRFYQFWINTDDRDVGRYLRYFTLLQRDEIEALEETVRERPESREAQSALAFEVTARVHGDHAARLARDASRLVFDRKSDPKTFSPATLELLRDEIPFKRLTAVREVAVAPSGAARVSVVDMLVETSLASSKSEARRQIQQGAVSVNGRRLAADEFFVEPDEAVAGVYFFLRKGSREVALVELA